MRTGLRAGAAVLLLGAAMSACTSGDKDNGPGEASGAPDNTRSRQAYEKCLTGYGVEVTDGKVREEGISAPELGRAYRECRSLAPEGVDVPVTKWEVELLGDYVACMRAKGYEGYTDPDPTTGKFEVPAEGKVSKDDDARCLEQADQKAGP